MEEKSDAPMILRQFAAAYGAMHAIDTSGLEKGARTVVEGMLGMVQSQLDWARRYSAWALEQAGETGGAEERSPQPLPCLYTAVEIADRAKEMRECAKRLRDGTFNDISDAVEEDAKMLDYAAALARVRYEAKQQLGAVVYDLNHLEQVEPSRQSTADLVQNTLAGIMKAWTTLSDGEENR